ncbi:phosphatase PAP2 family protein [Methanobacterium sp.]|uniref:phosphatase PAP2 family protein n=1 Tax=Methanobacterium sp. TaxID=2164 RepID=UPI003C752898
MHNILLNGILNYNTALFYAINDGMDNSVFNSIMPILTNFGSLIAWSLVCILIFLFGGQYGKKIAILGLLALFLSSAAVLVLKYIIAEPRPFLVLNHVHLLTTENDYSFPSGHATASFAAAVAIGAKYSFIIKDKAYKLIYPLLVFATIICFSRVYVGVHYPLDVVFGAIIGIVFALIVLRFEDKIFEGKISNKIGLKKIINVNIAKKLKNII